LIALHNIENYMLERKIEIVKLLSDLGANPNLAGASLGPDAMLHYDHQRLGLFTGYPVHSVEQQHTRDEYHELTGNSKYIDAIYSHLNIATEKIIDILKFDGFPFVLSGDHSNGAATLAGLRAAHPNAKIGVIWIDAHADLHTPYTTPSGNMHGMPMAMSLYEDNLACKSKEMTTENFHLWENIKNLGVNGKGNVGYEDVLFIDIRDLETEEWHLINENNIAFISPEWRKTNGISAVISKAIDFASKFEYLYVSFDIDSIDESLVPGTGTPVPNGLNLKEAGELLASLWKLNNLSAFEITEINPKIEQETTLKNVYEVLTLMLKK